MDLIMNVFFILLLFCGSLFAQEKSEILAEEGKALHAQCLRIATQFYVLEEGVDLKEITQIVLNSNETKENIKQKVIATGRRFFLFVYPSDGFQVKGYISFVPNPEENNLLVLLRGGNRIFGLMPPASAYSCVRNYTVIATAYRGGVSQGVDQFGGDEVNDVQNLMLFFPTLSEKLGISFRPKNVFMLGASRGGMEMFLALGRSPCLQQQISKAASLSGMLDIRECMLHRADMRNMFMRDFGLVPEENEDKWVALRDPLNAASHIRKDLPILILQGAKDLRVSLNEGYHMLAKLRENGNFVDYIEVPEGDHCLANQSNRMELIADWFEK
jgi:dipeptidyl aminopeptidase/acylaminoacyl peptidase